MVSFPNCKINIGLYITNRRSDGYHDLETIFYPVSLRDALEIVPAIETNLHVSGKEVSGNTTDNLVWKAWQLLQQKYPAQVPAFDIWMIKSIPMGAGLGGGSADAAFMLQLINDYCKLNLSGRELRDLALQLGSDCPFFIYNIPQFAEGRGEKMSPVDIDLSAYSIQLVCPDVHISTAKAFQAIVPAAAPFDLRKIKELPIELWKEYISNDFEIPMYKMHPELEGITQQLYDQGAIYAAMSGSGSTLYGIFEKDKKAEINGQDVKLETFYIA